MIETSSNKSPIFIVGTPRSGTTLTARILDAHSHIFMPGETHFFEDIYSRKTTSGTIISEIDKKTIIDRLLSLYKRFNEQTDQKRINHLYLNNDFRQKLLDSACDYKSLLDFFMETQMHHEKKQRWGNNVPKDIFHIAEILALYPDAKIVVCVRDIRDFLLSYSGKWKITSPEHVDRLKKLYHPVVTSFLWKSSMKLIPNIKEIVPSKNFFIMKYENLVSSPEKEIQALCTVIEEEFEPKMLVINSANSSAGTKENGIFSSSIGRWRNELSPEDAYIGQRIACREMDDLGYTQVQLNINLLKVAIKCSSTSIALARALYANKDSRGPLVPYIYSRVKSILS